MPDDMVTYAFVAGEVAPAFRARGDLSKYALGLGLCRNFYVDYRGGISNCPGSALVGAVPLREAATRLERFRANGNDYILEFGDQYMRVIRNGGYIIEGAKNVTAVTQADPAVVNSLAHGYSDGDLIIFGAVSTMTEISGRYFVVAGATSNTFELNNADGTPVDSTAYAAFSGTASVFRVYTIVTPYAGDEPTELDFSQNKLDMRITHLNHERRLLTYVSDTDWTLSVVETGATVAAPENATITPSGTGSAGYGIVVTAISPEGEESLPSEYAITTTSVNFTDTAGSATYSWDPVPGATEYNVYRTLVIPDGSKITRAQETGFVGRTVSPPFEDVNITPDFTKTPPINSDPFAQGAITYIEVTAGGTGYNNTSTVSVSGGGGSGFQGYPVVSGGAITGVIIVEGGSGYSGTVTVTFTVGTGAAATATVGPSSGQNPAATERFQQRQVDAGTLNRPLTLFGSKPGLPNNHDVSPIVNDGDAYNFTLDSPDVTPIRHLQAVRNTLLVFTSGGIWGLRGGEGVTVTPLNAQADVQAYLGVSKVKPLPIDLNILYTQEQGSAVYAMTFTYYTESFQQTDISVLSSHLLGEGRRITRMEYLQEPFKLVYAVREDGRRLIGTYVPDQEVTAWTQQETRGLYKDHCVVLENSQYVLYQVVDRYINGSWVRFTERQDTRTYKHPEDSWFLDCGLRRELDKPSADLTFTASFGNDVDVSLSSGTGASVGDVLYAGGGKFEITAINSATSYTGNWRRPMSSTIPQTAEKVPLPVVAGEWEQATPTDTLSGLWHLEGETVSALGDGDAFLNLVVENGTVTLPHPATKITVGIPYTSRMESLPPTSSQIALEGSRKSVYGAAVRFNETRGAFVGAADGELYEVPPLLPDFWGDEVTEDSGVLFFNTADSFDYDASVAMEQRYPLPCNILGFVLKVEKGDD